MESSDNLDTFKERIIVLNFKFASVNNNIGFGDQELISTLLYGLDERYETIVNLIEQMDVDVLEWIDIVRRLRNFEDLNHNNHNGRSTNI